MRTGASRLIRFGVPVMNRSATRSTSIATGRPAMASTRASRRSGVGRELSKGMYRWIVSAEEKRPTGLRIMWMTSPQRVRALGGLAFALAVSACGNDRALERCTAAYQAGSYEEAARLCEEVHRASGDPQAGATAARALVQLREGDRALAWVERLKGTSAEPGLWSVAALVYFDRGEHDRAVEAYRHDLELLKAVGDHAKLASTHYGLFYVAWERNRYREALQQARLSFTEAGIAGNPRLQARAAEALYTVLFALGDLAGARRALDLADQLLPRESTFERGNILGNQGVLALEEGQPELARHHIDQALELTGERGDRQILRSHQLNLAHAHLDRGDLDSAERYLAEARKHFAPEEAPVSLFYLRARVARSRGRLDEAERSLAEALATDPVPDWAWELEHERGRVAEERGNLQAAELAYQRSVAILEDMRRTLGFDELKAWLLERKRQPFESLFLLQARAGRAEEALATVERAKSRTFQDALVHATSAVPATGWSAAVIRADALRDLLPAMSESPVAALLPVDRLLEALKDQRALVYFEAREELWLLDVAGGRIRPRRLATSLAQVRELADRSLANPDDPAAAEALGDLLLPADLELPAGQTLYVVPDGALARLPFAALRRQGRWLVEDLAVVYTPGLSTLASPPAGRQAASPPVVLADPRGDLAAAAAEGREVARFLGVEPHLGSAATRRALETAAGAPVLHIAGHAGWGPGGPWLELADGQVAPAAILNARVRPRLVVLASCASAFPSGRSLWGSPGAAFLAAGSGSVLATLGSVEDRNARDLVRHFYREGGAIDPAEGLARAQRALLAAGRPPSTWAPFVLLGADTF
jgi:CHAT domain-containing protein/Tfp pilus assembly protein PilF